MATSEAYHLAMLLGLAIGDSLGNSTEGLLPDERAAVRQPQVGHEMSALPKLAGKLEGGQKMPLFVVKDKRDSGHKPLP